MCRHTGERIFSTRRQRPEHGCATRGAFGRKSAAGSQQGAQQFVVFSHNGTQYSGVPVATSSAVRGGRWALNVDAFGVLPLGHWLSVVVRKVMAHLSNPLLCQSTPPVSSLACVSAQQNSVFALHVLGMRLGCRVQSTGDVIPSGDIHDDREQVFFGGMGRNPRKNPAG